MKDVFSLRVYKLYDLSKGAVTKTFVSKDNLISFLASHQRNDWWGTYRKGMEKEAGYYNHYLDHINLTFNDIELSKDFDGTAHYYLRIYVFFDKDNRIIDVRDYIDEICYISSLQNKRFKKRIFNPILFDKTGCYPKFRKEPVPHTGYRYSLKSFYRHPQTMNEMRQAANKEYKEYIRPKRRVKNLPTVYDDKYRSSDRSWKSQTKCRKQWQKKNSGK